jgi:hypothetical protein
VLLQSDQLSGPCIVSYVLCLSVVSAQRVAQLIDRAVVLPYTGILLVPDGLKCGLDVILQELRPELVVLGVTARWVSLTGSSCMQVG